MTFRIKVDFRDTQKGLNRIARKQIPFATARALTELAKDGQRAVRANTKKKFDLRADRFILRNIRIKPAKKRDVHIHSEVFTDEKITDFMVEHEEGDVRTPRQSKRLSIPAVDLKKKSFRKAAGGVKRKFQPKTLLEDFKDNRGSQGAKTRSRRRKPFIIRSKDGLPIIVRRVSKRRLPLEILYNLGKQAEIKKRWGFEKAVRGIVTNKGKRTMERSLNRAISSAK